MKHTQGVLVVLSLSLVSTCVLAADDFDISADGEYRFSAGDEYARLRVTEQRKTVSFVQDVLTAPVLFSGFSAVGYTKATFSDVWFDFGQSGAPGPFLDHNDAAHERQFAFSGSVITNVSSLILTGWDTGIKNKLTLDNGSRLYAQKISVSDAPWNIRQAEFTIRGGSQVETVGSVWLNDGSVSDSRYWYSGNRLEVTGKGSSLAIGANLGVGGVLNDGWAWKGSAEGGSTPGGNTLYVTNGGTVTVAGTIIVGGGSSTFSNALVVADGGSVTTKNLKLDISSLGKYQSGFSGDVVAVLDGGSLDVTGDLQVGYSSTSGNNGFGGGQLLVSNGTFSVGGDYLFASGSRCTNYVVRVSGPRASFVLKGSSSRYFFCGGAAGRHNVYVFENQAEFLSPFACYCCNAAPKFCTIAVRTGAKFDTSSHEHFYVGGSNTPNGNMTNLFSVASGASLVGRSFHVVGYGCELAVSNATVDVSESVTSSSQYGVLYGSLSIGASNRLTDDYYGKSTNCVLRLAGEAPSVIATNGAVTVRSESTVRYELPAGGYAGISPVVDTFRFHLDDGSTLELIGAEEMLARHATEGKNGKYILARAKNLEIPETVLEKAREKLPGHVTLKVRDVAEGKKALVLGVHATGLMILFR